MLMPSLDAVLNLAFALSLLCFLVMHASLLSSNATTIEVIYNTYFICRNTYPLFPSTCDRKMIVTHTHTHILNGLIVAYINAAYANVTHVKHYIVSKSLFSHEYIQQSWKYLEFLDILPKFLKIHEYLKYETKILMFTINVIILNSLDHELGAPHKCRKLDL